MSVPKSLIVGVVLLLASAIGFAQSNEDLPRRQYESGLAFLRGQRYAEALKDFQAVIDSFPKSQVADNAMLQMALYQIDIAKDPPAAQSSIDQLLKTYPDTDSAPMAYVVGGRISMAVGVVSVLIAVTLGTLVGAVAGFFGGRVDSVLMRVTDLFSRLTGRINHRTWLEIQL